MSAQNTHIISVGLALPLEIWSHWRAVLSVSCGWLRNVHSLMCVNLLKVNLTESRLELCTSNSNVESRISRSPPRAAAVGGLSLHFLQDEHMYAYLRVCVWQK